MERFSREKYEDFLKKIDLAKYREKYAKVKTVEMDLPYEIQALPTIYAEYWDNVNHREEPLSYEEYYKLYWNSCKDEIMAFRKKTGFGEDCDCYERGLEARIYRTWASLITQIQGGYVAEEVFGKGSVRMSPELDRKKIDIMIVNKDGSERLRIQVKKVTHRPEIARMHKNVRNENGSVDLYYVVPSPRNYEHPTYLINGRNHKRGELRPFTKDFVKWNPATATMDRLDNGFIIFTKNAFLGLE